MARRRTIQPHRNPKFLKLFFHPNAENPNDRSIVVLDFENEYRKIILKKISDTQIAWVDMANQKAFKVVRDLSKKGEISYNIEMDGIQGSYKIYEKKSYTHLIWGESIAQLEERISSTHEHYLVGKDTALEIDFMRKGSKTITSLECSFVLEGFPWPMIALCLHRFMKVMRIAEPV